MYIPPGTHHSCHVQCCVCRQRPLACCPQKLKGRLRLAGPPGALQRLVGGLHWPERHQHRLLAKRVSCHYHLQHHPSLIPCPVWLGVTAGEPLILLSLGHCWALLSSDLQFLLS